MAAQARTETTLMVSCQRSHWLPSERQPLYGVLYFSSGGHGVSCRMRLRNLELCKREFRKSWHASKPNSVNQVVMCSIFPSMRNTPSTRQTFKSDVLAPVSSPFCHSPPPESREIANELAHGAIIFDSGVREMCGNAHSISP